MLKNRFSFRKNLKTELKLFLAEDLATGKSNQVRNKSDQALLPINLDGFQYDLWPKKVDIQSFCYLIILNLIFV